LKLITILHCSLDNITYEPESKLTLTYNAIDLNLFAKTVISRLCSYEVMGQRKMKTDRYAFILISDKKYWKRLCDRSKTGKVVSAFVRKNRVAPKATEKLLFYVKKPVMQVRGMADFVERQTGQATELWKKLGAETCFASYDEYCWFAHGRTEMTFVRFRKFSELENPKSTEVLRTVLGTLQGFRGKYVDFGTAEQLTS
jgi:predicted transcriptional regulator